MTCKVFVCLCPVHAVRILCMMEREVTNGESENSLLREKIQTLSSRIDVKNREHQSEMQRLSNQLKRAHSSIVRHTFHTFSKKESL